MVFHALEAVKEGEKGRSTVVERTQYITRQKFFLIFCNLSLTFSACERETGDRGLRLVPSNSFGALKAVTQVFFLLCLMAKIM